ncbi:hypothetical protein J1614_004990 [Plenodomus biglobosus]|nr:hypothetical protein J1614_004990 [Plenodomus biglobosus]
MRLGNQADIGDSRRYGVHVTEVLSHVASSLVIARLKTSMCRRQFENRLGLGWAGRFLDVAQRSIGRLVKGAQTPS